MISGNLDTKKLILIGSVILGFIVFILSFLLFRQRNSVYNQVERMAINKKESFELEEDIYKGSVTTSPEITSMESKEKGDKGEFTGAPLDLSGEVKKQAKARTDLLEKVPYTQKEFSIDFDYREAKFIVTLSEPKDESKKVFLKWLKENYPNISEDEVIFK